MSEDEKRSSSGRNTDGSVRAVERALSLLEAMADEARGVGLSDLARKVGFPVSTVHRLLVTLQGRGFVRYDQRAGLWSIGRTALAVGTNFAETRNLVAAARPIIERIGADSRELINLGVLDERRVVFLSRYDPGARRVSAPRTSQAIPAHCSSIGKAIMASLPDRELHAIVGERELPAVTPNSIVRPPALLTACCKIRQTGFAIDDEENTIGLRCVAAPIFDEYRRPIAALSIAAPAQRLNDEQVAAFGGMLASAAQRITSACGGLMPRA
jgi:IclR family transcriptional regulator, acetate operon repressor